MAVARDTIDDQSSQLASLRRDVEQETARGDELAASVTTLEARVRNQDACIVALADSALTLSAIKDKQIEIHKLVSTSSAWAEARRARETAQNDALASYFEAYSAAFDGLYASANSWIDRGNAQVDETNRQLTTMNAEVEKANRLTDEVDALLDEYAGNDLSICTTTSSESSSLGRREQGS